jgi:CheY-like chemotaxis protein
MSDETRARAFEPFFTTKGARGTGLGLYSVYGIVNSSGGHIDLQSVPGVGTTFSLYFPLHPDLSLPVDTPKPARTPVPVAKMTPKPAKGEKTIMVVDDESIVRPVYRRLLENEGYEVLEAESGSTALDLSETHRDQTIDLLITDVIMPQMNGYELARALLEKRPGLKVLFVTGFIDPDQCGRIDNVDPESILEKPFLPEVLLEKVRELLETS